jgi:hypothetical protein
MTLKKLNAAEPQTTMALQGMPPVSNSARRVTTQIVEMSPSLENRRGRHENNGRVWVKSNTADSNFTELVELC